VENGRHVGRASNSAKKATPPMVNSINCLKLRIFRVFAEVKSLSAAYFVTCIHVCRRGMEI